MNELQIYIREVDGEKQVNCIGYFNCKFFNLEDLLRHQKNIYELIKNKQLNNQEDKELIQWYDVTEHMRVKLLTKK